MCHSYELLCHLIIVITYENLQRRKVTDSLMFLSEYMHLACVLAMESLTRICDGALILEPVTAASTNQRHVLRWAAPLPSYQPWTTPDNTRLIPTPAISSLPRQGFQLILKCKMPQNFLNIHISGTQKWGRGCPMGWNLTNGRQLQAGKFWGFLLFAWTVQRGNPSCSFADDILCDMWPTQ